MARSHSHRALTHWTSDGELVQAVARFDFSPRNGDDRSDHDHRDWIPILSLPPGATRGGHGDDWVPILSTGSDGGHGGQERPDPFAVFDDTAFAHLPFDDTHWW